MWVPQWAFAIKKLQGWNGGVEQNLLLDVKRFGEKGGSFMNGNTWDHPHATSQTHHSPSEQSAVNTNRTIFNSTTTNYKKNCITKEKNGLNGMYLTLGSGIHSSRMLLTWTGWTGLRSGASVGTFTVVTVESSCVGLANISVSFSPNSIMFLNTHLLPVCYLKPVTNVPLFTHNPRSLFRSTQVAFELLHTSRYHPSNSYFLHETQNFNRWGWRNMKFKSRIKL